MPWSVKSTARKTTSGRRRASGIDQRVTNTRYICQATQLPYFTTPLPWWDIRQYFEDYVSGNVTLGTHISWFCLF